MRTQREVRPVQAVGLCFFHVFLDHKYYFEVFLLELVGQLFTMIDER